MHRSSNHPSRAWLAPLLGVLAIAASRREPVRRRPRRRRARQHSATPGPATARREWTNEGASPCRASPPQAAGNLEWDGADHLHLPVAGLRQCGPAPDLHTRTAVPTSRTYTVAPSDVGSRLQFVVTASNSAGTGSAPREHAVPRWSHSAARSIASRRASRGQRGRPDRDRKLGFLGTGDHSRSLHVPVAALRRQRPELRHALPSHTELLAHLRPPGLRRRPHSVVCHGDQLGRAAPPPTRCSSYVTTNVVTPGNTAPPKVSGTAAVGKTLTESNGSWLPKKSTLRYQWESCDASGGTCPRPSPARPHRPTR